MENGQWNVSQVTVDDLYFWDIFQRDMYALE